jgi:hypothetical protein
VLSEFTSRTTDTETLIDYCLKREEYEEKLMEFYQQRFLRNARFKAYCGRKKAETTLVEKIKTHFELKDNKPLAIGFGDYSRKSQMSGCAPTPNARLRRFLSRNFPVFLIDEYRTSKINYDYNVIMKKCKLPYTKDGKTKKADCHKVLECNIPDPSSPDSHLGRVKVDRDINAAKNMYRIFKECINGNDRPLIFRRT